MERESLVASLEELKVEGQVRHTHAHTLVSSKRTYKYVGIIIFFFILPPSHIPITYIPPLLTR